MPNYSEVELEVSDDGTAFRKVVPLGSDGSFSFPPRTAKYFRVVFNTVKRAATVNFTGMTFGGPRFSNILERTGMKVATDLPLQEADFTPDEMIDPKALVDLTGKAEWDAPAGKWSGKAKKKGGIGTHVTANTPRVFQPMRSRFFTWTATRTAMWCSSRRRAGIMRRRRRRRSRAWR